MRAIITPEDFAKEISRRETKDFETLKALHKKTGDKKYVHIAWMKGYPVGYEATDFEVFPYQNN